jgi:release factor glutamine methyltransferase
LHEPASALSGGPDGLDAYRAVTAGLPGLLAPGGAAILELGLGQAPAVAALAEALGFEASLRADLAGIARAVVLRPRQ